MLFIRDSGQVLWIFGGVLKKLLKRRTIFAPLPETEPLLAKMQRALPKTKVLLHPC